MQECAVTEGLHACVSLGNGAKGDLRDCVLSSSGLDGVAAYGSSTEVDARNCKMVRPKLHVYPKLPEHSPVLLTFCSPV